MIFVASRKGDGTNRRVVVVVNDEVGLLTGRRVTQDHGRVLAHRHHARALVVRTCGVASKASSAIAGRALRSRERRTRGRRGWGGDGRQQPGSSSEVSHVEGSGGIQWSSSSAELYY